MTYDELMLHYARTRGLRRRMLLLPGLPVWLMALGFRLLTPVPQATATALVGELALDSVVKRQEAAQCFPDVRLNDFASVVRATSAHAKPALVDRAVGEMRRVLREFSDSSGVALGALRTARWAAALLPLLAWLPRP